MGRVGTREPYKPKRRVSYLSNFNLLEEVRESKNSYCSFATEETRYDEIVKNPDRIPLPDLLPTLDRPLDTILRVYTLDHIPREDRPKRSREKFAGYARVSFQPFQHVLHTPEGWTVVAKSHWVGGMENGHFSNDHGRLTNRLGHMLMKIVERYGTRGNFRGYSYNDEMRGTALTNLCQVALKFDEAESDNVFAYYTTCINNSFVRVLNIENKIQKHRDDMLTEAGVAPSITAQIDAELAHLVPPPVAKKRGRPKKAPKP